MKPFQFIKDYKNEQQLRESFFQLADNVFAINFQGWFEKGFWTDRYIPYSYLAGNQVAANVSVNMLDLIIDGEKRSAVQIGTVMTHPDYRNQGLSASLMNIVLEEYQDEVDFIYLFANQTVLDFYPQFGFEAMNELQYSMKFTSTSSSDCANIRKLDGTNTGDLDFIYQFACERVPVSQRFGTDNSREILMFHCMNVFPHDIYYFDREEVMIIFKKQQSRIDIFDVISKRQVNIEGILSAISGNSTDTIVFHYTPDDQRHELEKKRINDGLFVRTNGGQPFPLHIKHPVTSQA
ncbi:GNAT family N-acetyltransferase [Bacillus canaveralius]|uniref:GNAT family N-acetyltransferase n=1 Tax=Bacillus canaveralius TaxID=1403243 RepID=A0A2N5GHA9_9BACI|nr:MULTISPECIES: GNAT family N-acetyltransferase [Bacillus]PLR80164.1 GNAT family N-acetyltransferase [Bacillus canaveralius]PLR83832.1 GNAT family N-acetyltransferase [Bacillus sp. V33-4]PLR98693.1 GNAT family N-acetyltransferase [Bacillus canaveralius]RSK48195.1 GNAT family N-acetyltransferase [Bacillus canaveralius]